MGVNILELLQQGTRKHLENGQVRESESLGTLRGGSCGWMNEEEDGCVGTCPRRAWARMQGFILENLEAKVPMFQAGHHSEDGIVELLSLSWKGLIKREEEIPIRWKTTNGVEVTGRPDIVLGIQQLSGFEPEHGVEAKLVSSLWTALEVLQEPKTAHILQASHYSHILQIPWSLLYVSRTNWALLSDFALRKAPREGEQGSDAVEYVNRKKKIKDKKTGEEKEISFREGKVILPFYREYQITFNSHGEVEVDVNGEKMPSFISWDGIERFYNFVARMNSTGNVGPAPTAVNFLGEEKGYSECKYCSLGATVCSNGKKKISLDTFRELCENQQASILSSNSAAEK